MGTPLGRELTAAMVAVEAISDSGESDEVKRDILRAVAAFVELSLEAVEPVPSKRICCPFHDSGGDPSSLCGC
jgi:hypothetical protein